MHRVGQTLQRGIEGRVLFGETETHHRGHRIPFIERRYRDRRHLVVGDNAPAECLVGLVEAEWRKIDGQEISALRSQHGKAEAFQSAVRRSRLRARSLRMSKK